MPITETDKIALLNDDMRKLIPMVGQTVLTPGINSMDFSEQGDILEEEEYQIYCDLADNGEGIDITTGEPLKTYEEWLTS